eukprot:jgi/Ulvmu1/8365/UM042_0071.1
MGASLSSALDREPGAGLTKKDVERLKKRFKRLSGGSSVLSVQQFELIPELAGNPFLPRLFEMFAKDPAQISQVEFNSAIDSLLKAQSPEDRMQLAFRMFDMSGHGIGENELIAMLAKSIGNQMSHQQLQTVVRSTIHEHDQDNDGRLNYEEFKTLISQDDMNTNLLP